MLIICTHTVYSCTCTIQGTLNTRIYAHTCTYILVYMHHTTYTNTRTHAHIGAYILVHMHHTTYTRYSHRYAHTCTYILVYMHHTRYAKCSYVYTYIPRMYAPCETSQILVCLHIYAHTYSYTYTIQDTPHTRTYAHTCTQMHIDAHR